MNKLTSKRFIFAVLIIMAAGEAMADERYRVVRGDNLYRIGRKFGINYKEIMAANRLSKTTIYPNQILVIPSRKAKAPTKIVQATPQIRSNSSRTRISQPQPVQEYAAAPPIRTRTHSFQNSTVPRDPVEEPFAIARKLPPAPPIVNDEDPLGLGYNPTPKARPVEPSVIAHKVPTQPVVPQINPSAPSRGFARSREVPAAAHIPGRTGALDPNHFPMPSFKNPCTPKKSTNSSSSGFRSYTVQSGDSVWSISRKFGVAPLKLRTTNGILFSKVRPGMCLKIPASHGIWAR